MLSPIATMASFAMSGVADRKVKLKQTNIIWRKIDEASFLIT